MLDVGKSADLYFDRGSHSLTPLSRSCLAGERECYNWREVMGGPGVGTRTAPDG